MTATLYRAYNDHGTLLYIGSTSDWKQREKQHRYSARWWPEMADIELEEFPTIKEAYFAEMRAIKREQPHYNIRHKGEIDLGFVCTPEHGHVAGRDHVEEDLFYAAYPS